MNMFKAGFTVLLAAYGIVCARATDGTFLDRVDLIMDPYFRTIV
jgi:hypothetical protein